MMLHYTFMGFVLASAIVLAVGWLAYRLFLASKLPPPACRVAILSVYLLMLFAPLIVAAVPYGAQQVKVEVPAIPYMDIEGHGEMAPQSSLNPVAILTWVYIIGLALTALMALVNTARLLYLRNGSVKTRIGGMEVYLHDDASLSSFSWLNGIFIFSPAKNHVIEGAEMLVMHEKAHVEQRHWIDLLVAQAVILFQWFNPAAWLLRRELQKVHEYQADAEVLAAGVKEEDYQMLLINNISGSRFTGLTDGLNNCSLKQRIIMMQKTTKTRGAWMRCGALAAAVLAAGAFLHWPAMANVMGNVVSSAQQDEPTARHESTTISVTGSGSSAPTIAIKQGNASTFTALNGQDASWKIDGRDATYEEVTALNPDDIQSMTVNKDGADGKAKIDITLKNKEEVPGATKLDAITVVSYNSVVNIDNSSTTPKASPKGRTLTVDGQEVELKEVDGAYNVSDPLPEYPGGLSNLMYDLSRVIKFPESKRNEEVDAKVVLQFVVTKEGRIGDIQVIRRQGEEFDNAAVSALKSLSGNTWKPGMLDGKAVNVWYTLPVTFRSVSK